LAAFLGFTLPSVLLMLAFAGFASWLEHGIGLALLHGLKLVAVCVVAYGLWGMARQMTPDLPRLLLAAAAGALVLVSGTAWAQLLAIALGALIGRWACRHVTAQPPAAIPVRYGRRLTAMATVAFLAVLALALLWPAGEPTAPAMTAAFYRAGALVFGGGHVVLPLLQESLVDTGWIGSDTFLAGYGAAQALPGPMFSIAAFLGAEVPTGLPSLLAAGLAVLALFLPGFLLLTAALPAWQRLTAWQGASPLLAGINASVVGLLAAALYDPVLTQGVHDWRDVGIVAVGLVLLARLRLAALWTVAWCATASVVAQLLMQ
jgi:chromate transporter